MNIDRLYTLSQFVDLITDEEQNLELNIEYLHEINAVIAYNNFLKQPLKKEMFVNEIEKPHISQYQNEDGTNNIDGFDESYKTWKKSEKKVIFEDVEYKKQYNKGYQIHIDNLVISFIDLECSMPFRKTLRELAEENNGELKLKNVDI